jgi:hypothetical protein
MLEKITPRDIIALVVIAFCFVLISLGIDSYLYPIVTLVVGYYFSKRYEEIKNSDTNNGYIDVTTRTPN